MHQPREDWEHSSSMIVRKIKETLYTLNLNWLDFQIKHQILFSPQNEHEASGIRFLLSPEAVGGLKLFQKVLFFFSLKT